MQTITLVAENDQDNRTILFPEDQEFDWEALEDYIFAYDINFVGWDR